MRRLIVSLPDSGEVAHQLTGNVITIGRTGSNKIQINHPSVSAHHAKLTFLNGQYRIKDLDSTNKTYVRGVPISETVLVGQLPVRFGNVECRYEESVGSGEPVAVAAPPLVARPAVVASPAQNKELESVRKELNQLRAERLDLQARFEAEQKKVAALTLQAQTIEETGFQLTAILADTKKQLETANAEREKVRKESQRLSEQVEALKKQPVAAPAGDDSARIKAEQLAKQREEELAKRNGELTELRANLSVLLTERDAARGEREALSAQLKQSQAEIEKVLGQLQDAQRRVTELSRQSEAGSAQRATELADLKGQLEAAAKDRDTFRNEREQALSQVSELRARIAVLAAEKDAAGESQSAVAKEFEAIRKQLKAAQGEHENARNQLAETSAKLAGSEKTASDLAAKVAALEKSLDKQNQQRAAVEKERDTISATVAELNSTISALNASVGEQAKLLAEVSRERETLKSKRDSLSEDVSKLKAQLKESEQRVASISKERDQVQAALKKAEENSVAAENGRAQDEKAATQLSARLASAEEQARELAAERERLNAEIAAQKKQLESAVTAKTVAERQCTELKAQFIDAENRTSNAASALEKASKAADEAARQLAETRDKMAAAEAEAKAARRENLQLSARVDQQAETAAALAQEREKLQAECDALTAKVAQLEAAQRAAVVLPMSVPPPVPATPAPAPAPNGAQRQILPDPFVPAPAAPKRAVAKSSPVPVARPSGPVSMPSVPSAVPPMPAAHAPAPVPAPAAGNASSPFRLTPITPPAASVPPPPPPVEPAAPILSAKTGGDDDVLKHAVEIIPQLRTLVQGLIRKPSDAKPLREFLSQIQALKDSTAKTGSLRNLHQLASVVDGLVTELTRSPDRVSSSVLRTVSQAVDAFALLTDPKKRAKVNFQQAPTAFLVESELETQKEIATAMNSIHLMLSVTDKPASALSLLEAKRHDLVLINVELPDMNGVELCSRVRLLPSYKKTPILLLTGAPSVGSWAQWSLNGANDFITKPINQSEFGVKALAWALRGQVNNA